MFVLALKDRDGAITKFVMHSVGEKVDAKGYMEGLLNDKTMKEKFKEQLFEPKYASIRKPPSFGKGSIFVISDKVNIHIAFTHLFEVINKDNKFVLVTYGQC